MAPTISRLALILPLLALAACGPQAPEQASAPEHEPPGLATWTTTDGPAEWVCHDPGTGVTYSMTVPTKTDDPRIAALDDFRRGAGAEPVHYLLAEIDATTSTAPGSHGLWGAGWATTDYRNAGAKRALETAMTWPGWDNSPNADVPEVEQDANTGAKGWAILAADEPIESMVAPMVTPGAYEVPCDLY